MFFKRLLSGIVLVLIALLCNIQGGVLLLCVLLAASLIGQYELYRALGIERTWPAAAGYLAGVVHYVLLFALPDAGLAGTALLLLGALAVIMAVYVFLYPRYHASDVLGAFFGVLYVPVMLSFVYQTRCLPDGKFLVWLIFIASWGCDTAAYCVGMLFGRHKLAPVLSPKKSVEGAAGGVLGAALIGFLFAVAVNIFTDTALARMWIYPLVCGLGAVISQIGDLTASGIKRDHDIKDYGRLIPGHGGILDRFDSVIFTAWIIYALGAFFS